MTEHKPSSSEAQATTDGPADPLGPPCVEFALLGLDWLRLDWFAHGTAKLQQPPERPSEKDVNP